MREILFCGKRIDNGEWVVGYYMKHINRTPCAINDSVKEKDVEHIIFYDAFSDWNMPRGIEWTYIDPATLIQYTGLTDKNGKRIFEGDLITIPGSKRQGLPAPVKWSNFDARFEISRRGFNPICLDGDEGIYEVIGNIHDNPELLEGD